MAELDRELLDRAVDREVELLQPARHLDGPALVAEIALDLADDRRRRVRRELDAALEIEAVDRLEQADRSDLDQIVERLAAVGELDREIAHEIEVRDDEFVAQPLVSSSVCPAPLRDRDEPQELRKKLTRPLAIRTRLVPFGHYRPEGRAS